MLVERLDKRSSVRWSSRLDLGATKGAAAVLALALALSAGIYALRHALDNANEGVTLLYVVPIAIVAIRFGTRAGVLGALVSMGLFAMWDQSNGDVSIGPLGYTTRAVAFLTLGGLVGGFAAERRRLVAELEEAARTDPLTGVLNHGAFMEELERELTRTRRYGHEGAVMVIDLDRFKDINDTHGHTVGDQLLRDFAHALRGAARETDVVGRIGGDEFAVILPGTGADRAETARLRLVEVLDSTEYERAGGGVGVGASVGVAGFDRDTATSTDEVLMAADREMYEAKRRRSTPSAHSVHGP